MINDPADIHNLDYSKGTQTDTQA